MTKFIHAGLIAQYAQDANECEEPWWRWQYKVGDRWCDCTDPVRFSPSFEYRRKPKTIRIGEFDVPEPVREPLKVGEKYWLAGTAGVGSSTWRSNSQDKEWLAAGLIHSTKEAAQQHIDAVLSFTRRCE